MTDKSRGRVTHTVDEIEPQGSRQRVSIDDVLERIGTRAFGPLLLICAALAVLPTGAVPPMSLVTGLLIALIGGQLALGRNALWVPGLLRRRTLPASAVQRSTARVRPWAERADKLLGRRLRWVLEAPMIKIVGAVVVLAGLTFVPSAAAPAAVLLPGGAVLIIGLGLTADDGMIVFLGTLLAAAAAGAAAFLAMG